MYTNTALLASCNRKALRIDSPSPKCRSMRSSSCKIERNILCLSSNTVISHSTASSTVSGSRVFFKKMSAQLLVNLTKFQGQQWLRSECDQLKTGLSTDLGDNSQRTTYSKSRPAFRQAMAPPSRLNKLR